MRAYFFSAPLLLFLAACPDDQIAPAHGRLVVAPLDIDFGVAPISARRTQNIELSNVGDASLEVTISLRGTFTESLHVDTTALSILPGEKKIVEASFVPEMLAVLEAEIVFNSDSELTPQIKTTVHGRAISVPFSVEPKAINFGNIRRGRSTEKTITIKNLIDQPLTITLGDVSGPDASDFRRTSTANQTSASLMLDGGAETTVTVAFMPAELGAETAFFDVDGNCNVLCRERVTLTGVGVESSLSCTPASLDYRAINPTFCATKSIICENPESTALTIDDLSIEQATSEYALRTFAPIAVPAMGSKELEIDYCPVDLGVDRGRLHIETREIDGGQGMLAIDLAGEGGGPDINVIPGNLVFGAAIGNLHRRRIQIENTGYTPLEVRSYHFDPADAPYRVVNSPTPHSLLVGEAELVEIEFAPIIEGEFVATLIVDSNDGDEPESSVSLHGTGLAAVPCDIDIVPTELAFGLVQVGGTYTRGISLRSTSGDSCAFFEPRLESGALYRLDPTPPESGLITPAQQVTFNIVYEPTMGSPISGDTDTFLVEVPNETPSTIRVPIHAIAAPSDLVVYPNPIDFGEVRINFPRSRTVTLFNVGTNQHSITGIERRADSSIDFSMTATPALPLMLGPGTSVSIDLTYRSADIGTDTGTLEITSALLPGPILVDLTGQAGDDDCGDLTGVICSPNGESSVGAHVLVETPAGDIIETITDENGAYYLYCLPPGTFDIYFSRGHFRGLARAEVVAHETTVIEAPTCLDPGSANIAVVTGAYDHVQDILDDLNIEHEVHDGLSGLPPLLTDLSTLLAYDIVFLNCGMSDTGIRDPLVAGNLQMFVDGGGSLYASDWAYDSVEGGWPVQVDFAGDDTIPNSAQTGFVTSLVGQVLDPAILVRLGGESSVNLSFLGGYVVIDAAAPSTLVHVVGETLGVGTGLRPLLVSFTPSATSGRVVYTSFHNSDVFLDPGMRIVLEYLVFEL